MQRRCSGIGLSVSVAELEQVYRSVITMGEQRKSVSDAELRRIVERLREGGGPATPGPPHAETIRYGHGG